MKNPLLSSLTPGQGIWITGEGLIENSKLLCIAAEVESVTGTVVQVRAAGRSAFGGCWTQEHVFLEEDDARDAGRLIAAQMIDVEMGRAARKIAAITAVVVENQ